MTDNEIIKALECCGKFGLSAIDYPEIACKNCPLNSYMGEDCETFLEQKTLDLINRQKAEIERLKKEVDATLWDLPPMGGFHD